MTTFDQNIIVYTPDSQMRRPVTLLKDIVGDLHLALGLAWAFARRDISALYRQSLLGYVWAFLPPLGTAFVFLFLRSGGSFSTNESAIPYPVYVIAGTILWQIFADSLNGPLKAVASNRAMLVKIRFPQEAIVLSAVFVTGFNFLIRLAVLIPALAWFGWQGQFVVSSTLWWAFPLGVLGLVLLGYSLGVLLTPAGMFYNDITMGLQTILIFWMLLSPVVMVRPDGGAAGLLMGLNLVTYPLEFARNGLVGQPLSWLPFLVVAAISGIFLLVGVVVYRVALPHTIARMGM